MSAGGCLNASSRSVGQVQKDGSVFQIWASRARLCRAASLSALLAAGAAARCSRYLASGSRCAPQKSSEAFATCCRSRGSNQVREREPSLSCKPGGSGEAFACHRAVTMYGHRVARIPLFAKSVHIKWGQRLACSTAPLHKWGG